MFWIFLFFFAPRKLLIPIEKEKWREEPKRCLDACIHYLVCEDISKTALKKEKKKKAKSQNLEISSTLFSSTMGLRWGESLNLICRDLPICSVYSPRSPFILNFLERVLKSAPAKQGQANRNLPHLKSFYVCFRPRWIKPIVPENTHFTRDLH